MNPKQKKLLIILGSVLIVLILLFTAILLLYQNDDSNPSGDGDTEPSLNVELSYWGLWEPESVMQPFIDEYEEANPGVTILYSQQAFTNYENILYTRLQQAESSTEPAPDIFRINNTWTPKYYKYLSPLPSTVMDQTTYSETFYPTASQDFTAKDGNIYALPWEIDGLALFYNKQLLNQAGYTTPPSDWDSFIDAAQEMTVKNSFGQITTSGAAIGTANNIKHSADILSYLMLLNNVDIIDSTYTSVNLTSSNAVTAMSVYTQFSQGDDAIWTSDLRDDL
jgi:multiple sugar transport system substrate-binding protein